MTYFFCLHTALSLILLHSGNCSSTLCSTTTGCLLGRNCMLLFKLTKCSSLITVFLWMWLTRILVIQIQTLWQDVPNMEYLPLFWKISYLLCQFNILYCMESYIFICKDTMGKLTVHLHTLSLQLFDQRKSVAHDHKTKEMGSALSFSHATHRKDMEFWTPLWLEMKHEFFTTLLNASNSHCNGAIRTSPEPKNLYFNFSEKSLRPFFWNRKGILLVDVMPPRSKLMLLNIVTP